MNRLLLFGITSALLVCSCLLTTAQTFQYRVYETDGISSDVYEARRQHLISTIDDGSLIAVLAAEPRNRQNDVDYEYRQNSNLLYLTGYPDPGAVLLLTKSGIVVDGKKYNSILFVRKRLHSREVWTGVTAGIDESKNVYGIDAADVKELPDVLKNYFSDARNSAVGNDTDTLFVDGWPTAEAKMPLLENDIEIGEIAAAELMSSLSNATIVDGVDELKRMREVKDEHELRLLKKAVDITVQGHIAAMKGAEPGMKEYQVEALMEYAFKNLGAEDVGYPSIVGSSYNACILHYINNRRPTSTGDLILADCGAEYHGYTADVTRTFPMSGTFTEEQRTIYNIVLEAQDSGIAASVVGNPFREPHYSATRVIARELIKLGIIEKEEDVRKYFMHGTSHYLGLDVHDPGSYGPLKANSVITVEPGIYIPEGSDCDKKWWNIGVRIEDDILITPKGPVNLSGDLVRSAEGIEALMSTP